MSGTPFEYEERYKVTNPEETCQQLKAAGFIQTSTETQTDRWYIPRRIMSSEQQSHWFDHEQGYALRIREETTLDGPKTVITTKQLLKDGDHSAMTNNERPLSTEGMREVLSAIGPEFAGVVAQLANRTETTLSTSEARQLIESAGRKEYIVLQKQRRSFYNPAQQDVKVDLDSIPALQNTQLGFWSSIEFEYVGTGSPDEAQQVVRAVCQKLGYTQPNILAKALPGLAIPYLASF